jgi:hypothetical protein
MIIMFKPYSLEASSNYFALSGVELRLKVPKNRKLFLDAALVGCQVARINRPKLRFHLGLIDDF